MSRKGKKKAKSKFRAPTRPAGPLTAVQGGSPAASTGAFPRSVSQARVGGDAREARRRSRNYLLAVVGLSLALVGAIGLFILWMYMSAKK